MRLCDVGCGHKTWTADCQCHHRAAGAAWRLQRTIDFLSDFRCSTSLLREVPHILLQRSPKTRSLTACPEFAVTVDERFLLVESSTTSNAIILAAACRHAKCHSVLGRLSKLQQLVLFKHSAFDLCMRSTSARRNQLNHLDITHTKSTAQSVEGLLA
jgi:hypothetical protein